MEGNKLEGGLHSCSGAATQDWYAWTNHMPPPPDDLHVVAEVQVANPGVVANLVTRTPPGINPRILLLDLQLIQQPGIWPQVLTWKPVRYDRILHGGPGFERVNVFCGNDIVADLEVMDVH